MCIYCQRATTIYKHLAGILVAHGLDTAALTVARLQLLA